MILLFHCSAWFYVIVFYDVCFSPSCWDVLFCAGDSNYKAYSIDTNNKNQIMIVRILYNWSDMYSNYNSIIKIIGFESFGICVSIRLLIV